MHILKITELQDKSSHEHVKVIARLKIMHERSRKLVAELQGMIGKKNEENEVLQQELHSATQMLFELCVKTLGYVHRHQENPPGGKRCWVQGQCRTPWMEEAADAH